MEDSDAAVLPANSPELLNPRLADWLVVLAGNPCHEGASQENSELLLDEFLSASWYDMRLHLSCSGRCDKFDPGGIPK